MLDAIRIRVDGLAGEIRRVMEFGGGVPCGDSRLTNIATTQTDRATQGAVAIFVVERQHAIGGMLPPAERIVRPVCRTESLEVSIECAIRAAARGERRGGPSCTAAREDLYDTAHRVCAIKHTGGAADDLDAVDVVRREMTEVERTTDRVNRNTVDQYFRVATLPTAKKERSERSE